VVAVGDQGRAVQALAGAQADLGGDGVAEGADLLQRAVAPGRPSLLSELPLAVIA
jgi:hypothetical protein